MLTTREAKYINAVVAGESRSKAARLAGFPQSVIDNPARLESPELLAELERIRVRLVDHAIEKKLVDTEELHERLSDEYRGDIADLYDPETGDLLPIPQWPMWARNGGVEVLDEPNMVHSADEGGSSWDQVGRRIKVKMGPRSKTAELLAKLKPVAALVEAKTGGDVHLHLHAEITQKLQGALARKQKLIDAPKQV